jgi:hypothetical protein
LQVWQAGETIEDEIRSVESVTARRAIDYVLYADGSMDGPDSCHESLRIQGMQTAIRIERSRLRTILQEKGVQALVNELKE